MYFLFIKRYLLRGVVGGGGSYWNDISEARLSSTNVTQGIKAVSEGK